MLLGRERGGDARDALDQRLLASIDAFEKFQLMSSRAANAWRMIVSEPALPADAYRALCDTALERLAASLAAALSSGDDLAIRLTADEKALLDPLSYHPATAPREPEAVSSGLIAFDDERWQYLRTVSAPRSRDAWSVAGIDLCVDGFVVRWFADHDPTPATGGLANRAMHPLVVTDDLGSNYRSVATTATALGGTSRGPRFIHGTDRMVPGVAHEVTRLEVRWRNYGSIINLCEGGEET